MTANTPKLIRKVILLLVISIAMLATACSKTVVRENILSSIETGIGLFLAENKQTQMYELKAGYFRSQFYSIPTGKVVEAEYPTTFINMSSCRRIATTLQNGSKDEQSLAFQAMSSCRRVMLNNGAEQLSNAANVTPEVVSGIHANMGLQDIILGMKVSENFAVGQVAVNSKAATAMYITETKDPGVALAASQAAASVSKITTLPAPEVQSIITLINKKYTDNPDKREKIKNIVISNGYKNWNDFTDAGNYDPVTLIKIYSEVNKL